jgi:hypothetical protein
LGEIVLKHKRVKIVDPDTGHVIREGFAREEYAEKRLWGIFSGSDIIRNSFGFIGLIFAAGVIWATTKTHLDTIDSSVSNISSSVNDFKKLYWEGHKELINTMSLQQEKQNVRIDCLGVNLARCCKESHDC